ncbi:MAG: HD domain-containing protein, partial [Anaerolineales bacterium]
MKSTENIQTIEQLLAILPPSYTEADRELILRAYRVAEEAHREQKRASGEPYITHCLAVAGILAELRVPAEVVAAGLLHDTVEDTYVTLDDLCRDFGET